MEIAANARTEHDPSATDNARMRHAERRHFYRRMAWDVGRSQPVLNIRAELRELGRQQGCPVCYPLCDGLVLTADGVRHGLRSPDGHYCENRPLWAWNLDAGSSAADAEARVRRALDAYGEGDHRWVYPAGKSLEQREVDELAVLAKVGCLPVFSVFWAMRAAVRLGSRLRPRQAVVDQGRSP